ncbi:hypothetical protein Rhopal_006769-T1 [Rhodotorula paludigena]|uniref:Uncharacterized protein n=1 Tax=Rhodotorula paludigena TaxID=86838 RepID=A0AAV5GXE8_9BASI|nr:hypothetical protein Rhopal_006769-T1 [Rhodotorula paludigena]
MNSILTTRWAWFRELILLGSYMAGMTFMFHLFSGTKPTLHKINLDPIWVDSAAVAYGTIFIAQDQLPSVVVSRMTAVMSRILTAEAILTQVYKRRNPLELLDKCLTGLSGAFTQLTANQLSAAEITAEQFAYTAEFVISVGASLAGESEVQRLLEGESVLPAGWYSLNQKIGGKESKSRALAEEAQADLEAASRDFFRDELESSEGMGASIYVGKETSTGGDRSLLILVPNGLSRYARLKGSKNKVMPGVHAYEFTFKEGIAQVLVAGAGDEPTSTSSIRLVDPVNMRFEFTYSFPGGRSTVVNISNDMFTLEASANLLKLARGQ